MTIISMISPWSITVGPVLIFGATALLTALMPRLIVRAYPKEHPRRDEILAEIYYLPYPKRVAFVFESFELVLSEGVGARIRAAKSSRRERKRVRRELRNMHRQSRQESDDSSDGVRDHWYFDEAIAGYPAFPSVSWIRKRASRRK